MTVALKTNFDCKLLLETILVQVHIYEISLHVNVIPVMKLWVVKLVKLQIHFEICHLLLRALNFKKQDLSLMVFNFNDSYRIN